MNKHDINNIKEKYKRFVTNCKLGVYDLILVVVPPILAIVLMGVSIWIYL